MTLSEQYANDVLSGRILVGKLMFNSCRRFSENLKRDDIFFDRNLAEIVVELCESLLVLWEGKWRGEPVKIHPWQGFIIQNIFCWKTKDGKRLIREAYIQVARKNAKTALASIIAIVHMVLDDDPTPQVIVGANKEEQAKICSNSIGKFIQLSPYFSKFLKTGEIQLFSYKKVFTGGAIQIAGKDGKFNAISKDSNTQDGFNPSLGIIDEYHAAKDSSLLDVIDSGQGARENPMIVIITTAGFDKSGVCYTLKRKAAVDLVNGIIQDDSMFVVIYEPDKEDDWKDESTWIKSNPMIPHLDTILPYLRKQCLKAINEGSTSETNFKTKNLDLWVDAADVWIQDEIWVANHNPKLKESDLLGMRAFGGLDLAATRDLNAYTLLFDQIEVWGKSKLAVLGWFWIPEDNVVYRNMNYTNWVNQGYINTTPGNHSNQDLMVSKILETRDKYRIVRLHYDRYLAESMAPKMADSGIEVYPVSMAGYNLNQSMKRMEVEILAKNVEHFNNPVFRWSLANLEAKFDPNGNIRPNKSDPNKKIDPSVSKILAFDAMIKSEAEPVYEPRIYII